MRIRTHLKFSGDRAKFIMALCNAMGLSLEDFAHEAVLQAALALARASKEQHDKDREASKAVQDVPPAPQPAVETAPMSAGEQPAGEAAEIPDTASAVGGSDNASL